MEKQELRWVRRAKRGDKESFAKLYETVYEDMYRFALYTLGNEEDAYDAVQETALSAFDGIDKLRTDEAFRAWIFSILTNKCRAIQRRYVSERAHLMEKDDEELPETLENRVEESGGLSGTKTSLDPAEALAVREAFFGLSDIDRLILSLHIFGGFSGKEIGGLLSMNDATVRSRKMRALTAMKRMLSEG